MHLVKRQIQILLGCLSVALWAASLRRLGCIELSNWSHQTCWQIGRQTSLMRQHAWKGQLPCPGSDYIVSKERTHTHTHLPLLTMPRQGFVVTLPSWCQEGEQDLPAVLPPYWPTIRLILLPKSRDQKGVIERNKCVYAYNMSFLFNVSSPCIYIVYILIYIFPSLLSPYFSFVFPFHVTHFAAFWCSLILTSDLPPSLVLSPAGSSFIRQRWCIPPCAL